MYSSYCESVVLDPDRPVMELVELLRKKQISGASSPEILNE